MSINSHLVYTASKLIITDSERNIIDNHLLALNNKLNAYFTSTPITEKFAFGSYSRRTLMPRRADGRSDVDYMIVFEKSQYQPSTYLDWLRDFATAKYSNSERYQSHPTIVLELSRIKIELVPATKNGWDNYQIPAPSNSYTNWITTTPNSFNQTLTAKNTLEKSMIRPLIRLMKYWNAQNGYVFSSYLLEKMVTEHIFIWCTNLWDYLYSFVNNLNTYLMPNYKAEKVDKLKALCNKAKEYEKDYPTLAEFEIVKAFPIY